MSKRRMGNNIKGLKKVVRAVRGATTIAISGHINPDGDSLGSLLALGLGLERMGKRVYMLCQSPIPESYAHLPGAKKLLRAANKKIDLAIAVDCSTYEILGSSRRVFENADKILEIDHHMFRRAFGDIQFVNDKSAAVGEMVYEILSALSVSMTRDIAEDILTSIIVETNLFRLSNVTSYTFKLCSELLKTGIDFSGLVRKVYGPKTKKVAELTELCLSRCKFLAGGRIAWSIIKNKDLARLKAHDYDADAIAGEINAIEGVYITVFFREAVKNMLRVSLRSRGNYNVGSIAEKCRGGGHFDIAGCLVPNKPESIRHILASVKSLL